MYEFDVVILEDEWRLCGFYSCFAWLSHAGGYVKELMDNVREAVELYLETLTEEERIELLRQRVVGIQKLKALA